tara:strand:+ start:1360 stop:1734 length:375 start_codon:yes stop_codon:yes gene_type:complete
MNNQTFSNSTSEKDLLPWSQPPTTIRIEDLTKEINEVKAKKNELARKEKELLEKFKKHVEKEGLDSYEDGEENRFAIGEVLIERRLVKRWTYTDAIKKLQEEEIEKEIAQPSVSVSWYFSEAKK